MRLKSLVTGLGFIALAGCGAQKSSEQPAPATKPAETANVQTAEATGKIDEASLPTAALVRVPVDENGKPTGAPEMKVYTGAKIADDADALAAAWDQATPPQKVIASPDELDGDTSTQSWCGGWGGYGGYGYGGWGGYGGYGGYGNGGYNLYYGGGLYGYGLYNPYSYYGGYGYYGYYRNGFYY